MKLERVSSIALLPLLGLVGCGYQGPAVAGYPGLQNKIMWYYDSNALEQNATCTQPRMRSITSAQVIDENQESVAMRIRYYWLDEGQLDFDQDGFGPFAGVPLQLPRREAAILEHLLRRQGRVVPKSVLEEKLYGIDQELESNAVPVHVHHLRRKLQDARATAEIHTVRGVGYLLMETEG